MKVGINPRMCLKVNCEYCGEFKAWHGTVFRCKLKKITEDCIPTYGCPVPKNCPHLSLMLVTGEKYKKCYNCTGNNI